jgi:hypothetical protein
MGVIRNAGYLGFVLSGHFSIEDFSSAAFISRA